MMSPLTFLVLEATAFLLGVVSLVCWKNRRTACLLVLCSARRLWYLATAFVLLVMAHNPLLGKSHDGSRKPVVEQPAPLLRIWQTQTEPIRTPSPTVAQSAVKDKEEGPKKVERKGFREAFLEELGDPLDWPWY